jgi:methylmalonyl-CoA mutase, N-terminal domain
VTYLEYAQKRGLEIDAIATRLSAQFYYYGDFLQEAAKTRAARRIWSRLLRDRFGAKAEASLLLRITASVGGTHFQVHEPETNIIRGTLGCLGAVLGGCQGMLLAGYDEAFDIPTEDTARIALRTQQIVGYESDATAVADPLGGSWFVEQMTDEIEALVLAKMKEIDEMGGSVVAIESGYMQRQIANSAYNQERREQSGDKPIVAVNIHRGQHEPPELVGQRLILIHQTPADILLSGPRPFPFSESGLCFALTSRGHTCQQSLPAMAPTYPPSYCPVGPLWSPGPHRASDWRSPRH